METSEQINELATAMAAAQQEMTGAKRDSDNPYFKSKYADLASVREACLGAMNTHGLSVWQFPRLVHGGDEAWLVEVETLVMHASGQFVRDSLAIPVTKADAQGVGSAISYARRYALGAVAGIAPEDDDGNAAVGPRDGATYSKAEPVVSEGTRSAAPDDGRLYVVQVNARTKGGKTDFTVMFSDEKKFLTKSDFLASLAEQMRANGTPCQRDTNRTYLNGLTSDDADTTDDIDAAMPTRTAEEPPI